MVRAQARHPPPAVLAAALPHTRQAEFFVRRGALPAALHCLDDALAATSGRLAADEDEARSLYKLLIRLSRRRCDGEAAPALLAHLRGQAKLLPCAATAHLVVADALYRSPSAPHKALALVSGLRADSVPLSSGTFDLVIQAAGRASDRPTAFRAYNQLRRAGLRPSQYTLNGLLNVERRSGRAEAAVALLRKAARGTPRWPGARPDAWSWTTGMAAATDLGWNDEVESMFRQLGTFRGGQSTAAFNVLIKSRLGRDRAGAMRLYRAMLESDDRSTRAAPPPDATTFNTVLGSVLEAKEPYTWLLRDAASVGITPDARTLALMLKNQPDLAAAPSCSRRSRPTGGPAGCRRRAQTTGAAMSRSRQTRIRPRDAGRKGAAGAERLPRRPTPRPPTPRRYLCV